MARRPRSRPLFMTRIALPLVLIAPVAARAETGLDTGDTAWVLASTALVLFMTLPGLALFYGGLVRTKNVLSVLMQCLALAATTTVVWTAFGYSLAFGSTDMREGVTTLHSFIGGLDHSFLRGIDGSALTGTIPEILFALFQMTFAIITPALMVGAFAERMRFSAMLAFCLLWLVVVYLPICHMTWGGAGAYFADLGVMDFAGGIVVHITAGVGALVACIAIGPRAGYGRTPMVPHNLTMCVTGTGMLWVGWYGFNGGSALAADAGAAMAATVTQISAAMAAITWMVIEWHRYGRPSVLGVATGAIAGLAAVTPASGFIGPVGGLAIGLASGAVCYVASTLVKNRLGYDDSLDVFGVHGVGGFVGTVLAGIFASEVFGGTRGNLAIGHQLGVQLYAACLTVAVTAVLSWVLLKLVDATIGLRVTAEQETRGLDVSLHEETGYNY